mgnify:FL=1
MSALARRKRFGAMMSESQQRAFDLSIKKSELKRSTDPHIIHRICLLTTQGFTEDEALDQLAKSMLKFGG